MVHRASPASILRWQMLARLGDLWHRPTRVLAPARHREALHATARRKFRPLVLLAPGGLRLEDGSADVPRDGVDPRRRPATAGGRGDLRAEAPARENER